MSLGGDQESDAFYPPTSGGYDSYTIGAITGNCPNRFRVGCTPDAQGRAMTGFVAGKWQSRVNGAGLNCVWCVCLPVYRYVWHRPRYHILTLIPLTARASHLAASAVRCGDAFGACAIIATTAIQVAAALLTVMQNFLDLLTFISRITGSARQNIANANVRVLLGTLVVGLGGGSALV